MKKLASVVVTLAGTSGMVAAASPGPQPAPPSPAIAAPQDRPFPGTLRVDVDATDLRHKIFVVHETVPVQAGPLTLLYPQWETGSHAATSAVVRLAGLTVRAGASRIAWRRNPIDVHAFHVDVPAGINELALEFQYLSPPTARNGAIEMSPAIIDVPWHKLLLYPAGWFARDLPVQASLRVPAGFEVCTSLVLASPGTASMMFKTVALDELIDAPVYAGQHVRPRGAGARRDPVPAGPVG